MANHSYDIEAVSAAPIELVFEVIADAPSWSRWNTTISRAQWDVEGSPAPWGVGAVRALGANVGPLSRERIVEFDAPNHQAYVIVSGPMPIKDYRADVWLTSTANGGTHISWKGSWTTRVPGVSAFLEKMVRGFATGAAREAERLQGGTS